MTFPKRNPGGLVLAFLFALLGVHGNLLAQSVEGGGTPDEAPRPNIIFVLVDDLNDAIGVLREHPQVQTPNIDRLARKGTLFTNAWCSAPLCSPSRTSLLTGKHPSTLDLLTNNDFAGTKIIRDLFDPSLGPIYTLPEILKDSGDYYTYSLIKTFHGQFYPGGSQNDYDFDTATAAPCQRGLSWNAVQDWPDLCDRFNITPDDCEVHSPNSDQFTYAYGFKRQPEASRDARAADTAIAFLARYAEDPDRFCGRPFFLNIGFFRPHSPWFVAEEYYSEHYRTQRVDAPLTPMYNDPPGLWPPNGYAMAPQPAMRWADTLNLPVQANRYGGRLGRVFAGYADTMLLSGATLGGMGDSVARERIEENFRAQSSMAYEAGIHAVDAHLGRILDALEAEPKLAQNTIVVLASDHGFSLGEKNAWGKSNLWETALRVPLIVFDPRRPGGQRVHQSVSLLDLFPTMIDLAGIPSVRLADASMYSEGHSIVPLMELPDTYWNRPVLASFRKSGFIDHAVRDNRYHYIRYSGSGSAFGEELYEIGTDRSVDPHEWNNLASEPAFRNIMRELAQYLPDGPRYGAVSAWDAGIASGETPCALAYEDTLVLRAWYRDPSGLETPFPSHFKHQWVLHPMLDTFEQTEPVIPMADLDSAIIKADGLLRVEFLAEDTLSNEMTADVVEFRVAWRAASVGFQLVVDTLVGPSGAALLSVQDYQREGPRPQQMLWEFSNGQRFTDDDAPVLQWTMPGMASVQHTAYLHPTDSSCQVTASRSVMVDSSHFVGRPCPTPPPAILDAVDIDRAQAAWPAVFAGLDYEAALFAEGDSVALRIVSGLASGTSYPLRGLDPNTAYALRIRATCDTTQASTPLSDWSIDADFHTPNCQAPKGLDAYPMPDSSVTLSWRAAPEAMASDLGLWIADSLVYANSVPSSTVTLDLPDLSPSQTYTWRMRSRCALLDGSTFVGREQNRIKFTVPNSFAFRSPPPPKTENKALQLWPNPAQGIVHLRASAEPGPVIVRIVGLAGGLHGPSQQLTLQAGPTGLDQSLHLKGLPPGLYAVEVRDRTHGNRHAKLVVLPGGN